MDKFVALMHRYCHAYTNCQNFAVCDEIMVPGYVLHMGPYTLAGRDEQYKPATRKQFDQFPGLCLTVNEIITNGDRLLMRFTEHGASMRHDGAQAAWHGMALYKWDGERLTECYVEQDYYARREQLKSGRPRAVEAPAVAPWDTRTQPANPAAEATLRSVVQAKDLTTIPGIRFDNAGTDGCPEPVLSPAHTQFDDLFSAGDQVAFHVTRTGQPQAEFIHGNGGRQQRQAQLHMVGLVTIHNDKIVAGRVIRDRLGLYRRLRKQASAEAAEKG